MSQTVLYNTNSPLKQGHPCNQDAYICPNAVRNRGVPLYMYTCTCTFNLFEESTKAVDMKLVLV